MFKQDSDSGTQVAEPFAEEAKYFTESRLLQREVKIIMEGVSNQNILGTVLHPVSINYSRTPDRDFCCFYPHIPVPARGKDKKVTAALRSVTSLKCQNYVTILCILVYSGFSGSLFHVFPI